MSTSIQYEPPFSNLQMELLRLFDRNLSEAELLEVKKLLANHFLEKAMDAADKVWAKKQLDRSRRSSHDARTSSLNVINLEKFKEIMGY
jgi:hypothetical protein